MPISRDFGAGIQLIDVADRLLFGPSSTVLQQRSKLV